jgi:hypothetical protein
MGRERLPRHIEMTFADGPTIATIGWDQEVDFWDASDPNGTRESLLGTTHVTMGELVNDVRYRKAQQRLADPAETFECKCGTTVFDAIADGCGIACAECKTEYYPRQGKNMEGEWTWEET